jgi:hypothetical protein
VPVVAEVLSLVGLLDHLRDQRKTLHALGERVLAWLAEFAAHAHDVGGGEVLPADRDHAVLEKGLAQLLPHRAVIAVLEIGPVDLRAERAGDGAHFHGLVIHMWTAVER